MLVSLDYPYLQAKLIVPHYETATRAYLDTGFEGYFVVPAAVSTSLGPPHYTVPLELADGSIVEAEAYLGLVEIVGLEETFTALIVSLGDEFLIGRGVIDRLRVTFDHGQRVEVEL